MPTEEAKGSRLSYSTNRSLPHPGRLFLFYISLFQEFSQEVIWIILNYLDLV